MSHSSKTRWVALRIVGYYVLFGSLWIVGSGWLLHHFVTDPATEVMLETVKGWAFVFVTGLLLASLLNRYLREIGRWADSLKESEDRWSFALDAAGYGVWDWNLQTNQVYYSPQWKALLGYSPEEMPMPSIGNRDFNFKNSLGIQASVALPHYLSRFFPNF